MCEWDQHHLINSSPEMNTRFVLTDSKQQMWTPTPFVTNLDETVSADEVEIA